MKPNILVVIIAAVFLTSSGGLAEEMVPQWNLADVTRIALDNNPDLKSARANYEASTHVIGEALSGYLPKVDLVANVSQTTLPYPSADLSAQVGLKLAYSSAVVQLNQVLFDFGKNLAQIRARQSQSHSAEEDSYAVKNAVILAAERAFYAVISGQKVVDAAKESVARYQETERRTEVLVKTGARPTFDLTQAKVELSKAKLGLINAQNSLDLAKIALINIMGLEQQNSFSLVENESTDSVTSNQLDLNHLTQKALSARPEIHSSNDNVDAAKHLLNGEITHYLPTFSAQAFYGSYQPNYPDVLRSAWGVGLTATWNLFDGLGTTARVGEFSSRLDQQEALREKERENVTAEVARAYMDLVRAEDNEQVSNEALEAAQENDRLAKKRYDAAVATILELLVANGSLVDAEASAIQAKYERDISLEQLKTAVNAPLRD
jgi:outer membrane protein TolC